MKDSEFIKKIIQPKTPNQPGWVKLPPVPEWVSIGYPAEAYQHLETGVCVISAVEVVDDEIPPKGPEFHLSITKYGKQRCTSDEAAFILKVFDVEGAEEDNHVPYGVARHFWLPVAKNMVGIDCYCKKEEQAIVEDKGDYVWRPVINKGGAR